MAWLVLSLSVMITCFASFVLIALLYATLCDLYVLVVPLHACLSCLCMFLLVFSMSSSIAPRYWFHAGSHLSLSTKSRDLLLGALFVGTLSSVIQLNGSMDAKSKPTFVPCEYIVSLIICFLICSLCLVRLNLFACFFAYFVAYDGWSMHATSKK